MTIFPVILCGGSGTRLWPASRPAQPKQFIDLVGSLSLFQETVRRVQPLMGPEGALVVVAGRDHVGFIDQQLAEIGVSATVLVEPEGRDSGPAMAAAAQWIVRRDPDGIALFVASDHHIPDGDAFRAGVIRGAEAARADGRIVTFGVRPTEPSSAYGYICPEGPGLSPVREFVEKPDRETAKRYLQQGYLWNSGNFVVGVRVLLGEFQSFAPEVLEAVQASLEPSSDSVVKLTDAFLQAPRLSIDYAVMEKSRLVSVLPVDFRWSDLGAWDTVAAVGSADRGLWIGDSGEACLVRVAPGMVVATAGISNLAIIAEPDAVLVCSIDRAQEVKGLVERLREVSPGHVRGPTMRSSSLASVMQEFTGWMRMNALPVWATLGVDEDGGFHEALDLDGLPVGDFRRARVQARQIFVYASAASLDWRGPWKSLVERALDRFDQTNLLPGGLYRTRVGVDGTPREDTVWLYDQAFVLLAFAAAAEAGVRPEKMAEQALGVCAALDALKLPTGGWREAGEQPYQANAHMHLLEACLAWETLAPAGPWSRMADQVVSLARRAFIDPEGGFLREFFNDAWRPATGEDGRLVEPGHQFEWAWLLTRWGRLRAEDWALETARKLYAVGARGVDEVRGVAFDALNDDLSVRSAQARLWPQTERLKAALILAEQAETSARAALLEEARKALVGLQAYLTPSGLWRDKMQDNGAFIDEAAPASSFYHIMAACLQVEQTMPGLGGARPVEGAFR